MYKKLEPFIAYLLGAPVKDREGRVWKRPALRKAVQRLFDPSLWGVDFSKWQGIIDFVKVKAAGIKFLILRASYGKTRDERFVEYITSAISVFIGWLFGVYHYYDPRYSPTEQANALLGTIAPYKKYIRRVWIDLEFTWDGNFSNSTYWREFAQKILDAGYEIGFYSRQTWWDLYVGNLAWWFAQYPLWAAQYSSSLTLIPKGWSKASLWQNGVFLVANDFAPGAIESKEYDHDVSDSDFYNTEFGGNLEPPPTGDAMFYKQVYSSDLSYRNEMRYPDSTVLGYLKPGDVVKGVLHLNVPNTITQWVEFTEIHRAADNYNTVEVVHAFCSGYSTYMQETTDPTPVPSIFITHEFNDTLSIDGETYEANFTVENVEYKPKA